MKEFLKTLVIETSKTLINSIVQRTNATPMIMPLNENPMMNFVNNNQKTKIQLDIGKINHELDSKNIPINFTVKPFYWDHELF